MKRMLDVKQNSHKSGSYVSEPLPPCKMNFHNGGNIFETDCSIGNHKKKLQKTKRG